MVHGVWCLVPGAHPWTVWYQDFHQDDLAVVYGAWCMVLEDQIH